jgi:hypothetical protein
MATAWTARGIGLKPRFAVGDVRHRQLGDRGVERGGDADQHVGAQAGRLTRVFALPPQHRRERGGDQQPDQELKLWMHQWAPRWETWIN